MADQMEATARAMVHDWMLHLGYTEEQIAIGDADPDHSLCVLGENGWYCLDEEEEDRHPIHGEMGAVAELVMFVLQHEALSGPLLPPGGESYDQYRTGDKLCRQLEAGSPNYVHIRPEARHTHYHRVTRWPDGAVLTGPWIEVSR